jgi:hypothetical protein
VGRPAGVKNKTGNEKIDTMMKSQRDKQNALKVLFNGGDNNYCISQSTQKCKDNRGFRNGDFYFASRSPMFFNKKIPICKECLAKLVSFEDGTIDKLKLLKILPVIDKPYIEEDYKTAVNNFNGDRAGNKTSIIGEYMRIIGSPKKINLGFSDSDTTLYEIEQDIRKEVDPSDIIVTMDLKLKWGNWLQNNDVKFLQYTYNQYVHYYSVKEDDPVQAALIRDICFQDLKLQQARQGGLPEKDILASKQALLNTSNLTPAQTAKSSTGFTIGAFVKHLEEDSPITRPSKEFDDVDNILKVFMQFFGHILSMMGVGNRGD